MTLGTDNLLSSVVVSLRDPRGFTRLLTAQGFPRQTAWEFLVLASLMFLFVAQFQYRTLDLGQPVTDPFTAAIIQSARAMVAFPMTHAIIITSITVLSAFACYWVGQMARGSGDFGSAVLVMGWVTFVWAILSAANLVVMMILPPLAAIFDLAILVIILWVMTNMVAELHKFQSLALVFLGILCTFFTIVFVFSFVTNLIGASVGGMV